MNDIHVFDGADALYAAAADLFVQQASAATGDFTVALPGGSTPLPLFRLLATGDYASRVDWNRVHIFFGDERAVPKTHADSNYGQAQTVLLSHVPISLEHVHRIHGEEGAHEAAIRYGQHLQSFFDGGPPAFDLHILGMGTDGHTASLFPGATAALHEQKHRAVPTAHGNHPYERITMTPWAINAAKQILILVSGRKKADMLHRVLNGPHQPELYPIQAIRPQTGPTWYIDQAAAARLETAGRGS